jgi:hypothetical protein
MTKIIQDISFKGIQKEYQVLQRRYKESNGSSGFLDPSFEKALKCALRYFVKNLSKFGMMGSLKEQAFKSEGDISKVDPKLYDVLKTYYEYCKDYISIYSSKNITEGSVLKMYIDVFDALSDSKNKAAFKKAIQIGKTAIRNNFAGESSTVMMIIPWFLLMSFLVVSVSTILNNVVINTGLVDDKVAGIMNVALFESLVESETFKNKPFMIQIGLASLHTAYYLDSLKDPLKVLNENRAKEDEARKEIVKSRESGEPLDFYALKDNGVNLVNKSGFTQSKESIAALFIVGGAIVGLILVVSLIRRAIYWIGSLKIDFIRMIIVENESLKINIKELEKRRDAATDPKKAKKIDEIIKKQQEWQLKLQKKIDEAQKDSNNAYVESEEQVKQEDENNEKEQDDDYEIIL